MVLLSTNPATRLRQLLARRGIVVSAPLVLFVTICDGISARCTIEAGFDCLYQSGAATTAARLGQPDLAIATLNSFASLDPTMPVIADADTGFGGPTMIARTVTKYARADQVQTKLCGHLLGKQVVFREEFVTRIRTAVLARDSIPRGSVIGRIDSAQVLGMDAALIRLKLAADAGADVGFIEGAKSKQLLEVTVRTWAPTPVLVNVIFGGLTPSFTSKDAESAGAKIINKSPLTFLFSLASCVPMGHALRAAMKSLRETGTDFSAAQGVLRGLRDAVNLDSKAGGQILGMVRVDVLQLK
ncbi:oxaloacetate acetylhydrolase [Mycena leptocephala]|nr:oxaloacetate acetylhydrolase [Mycena leptocephala]